MGDDLGENDELNLLDLLLLLRERKVLSNTILWPF